MIKTTTPPPNAGPSTNMLGGLNEVCRYAVYLYDRRPEDVERSLRAYFHIYADNLPQAIGDMTPLIGKHQFMELEEFTKDGPLMAAVLYADARLVPADCCDMARSKAA